MFTAKVKIVLVLGLLIGIAMVIRPSMAHADDWEFTSDNSIPN